MWFLKLTAREQLSGLVKEQFVRVPGDRAIDLLDNTEFKWGTLDRMLERGTLVRVDVDFRPGQW